MGRKRITEYGIIEEAPMKIMEGVK